MEVSDTRTDVATSLVITLFLIDPLCFDVAKAYDKLEHTATCSECELLIDAFEEVIDTVRKTDGALEDLQKLRNHEGYPPPRLRDSASGKGNLNDSEDEGFSVFSRKKKVVSIVIDASSNTTELLNTLSEYLGSTLEGRFENGKLRVFPKTYLDHRKLESYLAQKNMRSFKTKSYASLLTRLGMLEMT
ncbi:hypothetical protein TNCV_3853281 [Trichonephila clavipes]|nr:hypothetical protein TNCV_3853281 [Trichonephila clavipes]